MSLFKFRAPSLLDKQEEHAEAEKAAEKAEAVKRKKAVGGKSTKVELKAKKRK